MQDHETGPVLMMRPARARVRKRTQDGHAQQVKVLASALVVALLIPCCQSSLQNVQKEREAKLALMHETEKSTLAECELKRINGTLKTYTESAQCSNPVIIKAHEQAGDPGMNFVYLLTAYRLAVAERLDKGILGQTEANLMLAQLVSRINAERLQRDISAAQQKGPPGQSYEELLQGLAVWKGSSNQSAQGDQGASPRDAQDAPAAQPGRESPITCVQNGAQITCQ